MLFPQQLIAAGPELMPEKFYSTFLEKVRAIVESNYHNPHFGTHELALAILLSPSQLYRKIKNLTGQSPVLYLRNLRLRKSAWLLINTDLTIAEISYRTGFSEPAYFSRIFSAEYEMCPLAYRRCTKNPSF